MPSHSLRPTSRGAVTALLVVLFALALALGSPGAASAQRFTSELSGTVVDPVGGVVPGAAVTLTNAASGVTRQTVTNRAGFFAFSAVPAATYTVTVELQGFATLDYTDIVLRAGDSRTLRRIPLNIAARAETVSVSALVELTPLDSGERSTTIDSDFIEDLPIVSSNVTELLRILPGMTPQMKGVNNRPVFVGEVMSFGGSEDGSVSSGIGSYSANGSPNQSFDLIIDGAPGSDEGGTGTLVNPNTEMVQEFKVLQASFGAEHAKGPSSMTVVGKSGGRDFHGSAFLYFRDYHLNSNEWFANKLEDPRPKSRFLYPGFTLSGPLSIGSFNKDREKLFFFVGYEYYDQRVDTGYARTWVPTEAMRRGDFRGAAGVGSGDSVNKIPVLDGVPTPILPGDQIDPGGQVLLDRFPLPNADPAVTGGYNYVNNTLTSQPNHQLLTRLDWNVSPTTKVYLRYNLQRERMSWVYSPWWKAGGSWTVPYPTPILGDNRSDSITASLTHVFNPTLTSETIVAFTYGYTECSLEDRSAVSRQALGYPYQGVFGESGDAIPNVFAEGPNFFRPGGFDPVLFGKKQHYGVAQNLTKVRGTHTAKFGFLWERSVNRQPGFGMNHGDLTLARWSPTSTGNTFADLLLGRTAYYEEQTYNAPHDTAWNRWELYGQDSWKVSPRLTLDYGLRASLFEAITDLQGNGLAVWDESRYGSDLAAGLEFPGVTWHGRDPSVPVAGVGSSWTVQPRVGFAWDLRGSGETVLRGGAGLYLWQDPTAWVGELIDLGAGVRRWSGYFMNLRDLEGLGGGELAFSGQALEIGDDRVPRTWSWSLTLNQRLPWSTNLELGYVGNRSDHLVNGTTLANRNAVPLGAMLDDPWGNPQDYRPFQAYGPLYVLRHSLFRHYHGLQTLLARQRQRFNFTLAYTFSKALGFTCCSAWSEYILTPFRDYSYGPLADDRTHVATGSFTWLLPEPASPGALRHLLGGWQVSGILSYVSGVPLPYGEDKFGIEGTSSDGYDLATSTYFSGSPEVFTQLVLTCDPRKNVPDGYMFNPACFAAPTRGTNGNYNLPYMKGPPYWNVDLSLFKNFDLGGDRKLQLRLSAYNAFNHPIAYPDRPRNLTARFENGVLIDPGFGWLPTGDDPERGDANKAGRRIVQLAVRFTF